MPYHQEEKKRSIHTLLLLNLLSLAFFLFLLYEVLSEGRLVDLDTWISRHVPHIQHQDLTEWIVMITDMNGVVGSAIISLLVSAYLLYVKNRKALFFYWIAYLGGSVLFTAIKYSVERARPLLKIINEQGLSFPSGHSTMSMVMALSLYFIFISKCTSKRVQVFLLTMVIAWPCLIAFTRIYLNVHWLSDTLAGLSLGIFWVTLLILLSQFRLQK